MLCPCCGPPVIAHEHPLMFMAFWLAPDMITATRVFCVCKNLGLDLIIMHDPCIMQVPVPLCDAH
jgi:hypothetical protein